jgi:hypothetical protein
MSAEIIQFGRKPSQPSTSEREIYPWPWEVLDGAPFVDPPPPRRANGRLGKRNCWVDMPTENGHEDHARGRAYAKTMLSVMQAYTNACRGSRYEKLSMTITARALESVLDSMVTDAVNRQKKGGKYSRRIITPAMNGFLSELTRHIAGLKE